MGEERGAYAGEFVAAVTAFRGGAAFADMQVAEFTAGGANRADFVGFGVVPVGEEETGV